MSILTAEMRDVIHRAILLFIATVNEDGTPNLSPKASLTARGDSLFFADIASCRTIENLQRNPAISINVVDIFARRAYRFNGTARLLQKADPNRQEVNGFNQRLGLSGESRRPHRGARGAPAAVAGLSLRRGASKAALRQVYWQNTVPGNGIDCSVNGRFQDQSSIRHVGMGKRLVGLAMADDCVNEHAETLPSKIRRWARPPVTDKQHERLKLAILDQMSLYDAMPNHLQFQPERDLRPCPGARQTSGGKMTNWLYLSSMSNWLYLIGSFCFVAGTLLNMAER